MTWWPFGKRTFLDPDDEVWQIETWRWFLVQFGGLPDLEQSQLVLPTREFFSPTDRTGHERAEHIFLCVKRLARMSDWPCRLIEQPRRAELRVADVGTLKPIRSQPAGTFGFVGNEAVVSYEPSAVDDPGQLIATLAHELAHYRLAELRAGAPGGEELHEFTTDLMTVYLGFGVFGAAASFNFSQHQDTMSQGWQWSRHGYLSQRAWIFALAIFLALTGKSPEPLGKFLKSHLMSDLTEAVRYSARNRISQRIIAPSG